MVWRPGPKTESGLARACKREPSLQQCARRIETPRRLPPVFALQGKSFVAIAGKRLPSTQRSAARYETLLRLPARTVHWDCAPEHQIKKPQAFGLRFFDLVPGAGIEPARLAARDFESRASTNFTTRAGITC